MHFVVKFVAANVSSSVSKTSLYSKIVLYYHILQLTACRMVQKLR